MDGWLRASQATLLFCGISYALIGLGAGALFLMMPGESGDPPLAFRVFFGLMMLVVCLGVGAVNLAAAWGLGEGKKWSWYAAMILGGIYLPSGCLPFGGVLLYTLLRKETREHFGT